MVQGIINGDLTLEYEQLVLTNRGEQILESMHYPFDTYHVPRIFLR
jgi:hypothetical protein